MLLVTNNVALAEKGFFRVTTASIPKPVADAARSIFEVVVPNGTPVNVDLSKFTSLDEIKIWIANDQKLEADEKIIKLKEVKSCWDKQQKSCLVLVKFESGTVFPISDTKHIASVFHMFRDYARAFNVGNDEVSSLNVPIVLKNAAGKIIYGESDSETAKLSFVTVAKDKGNEDKSFIDIAMLTLSSPLQNVTPLVVADDKSLNDGDTVYSIGFPAPTYDRLKILNRADSNGVGQFLTYGPTISFSELFSRIGKDPKDISAENLKMAKDSIFYADSDGYFGMSGGPTLNKLGQVIGLNKGTFPVDGHADPKSIFGIIRMSWANQLFTTVK